MKNKLLTQSGRSMVEILGVLAVIGVLSVGGIAGYSKAMEKININNLIEDIHSTTRKIHNLYADQRSFEDLDKQVYTLNLVDGGRQTEGMNKKILHILNGEVYIQPIATNTGFVMVYNGLTANACTSLASYDWGGSASGLKYLVVSPTGVVPPRGFPSNLDVGEYDVKDLPLSPAEVAPFCRCDPVYKCGIAWFYGK